MYLDQGTIAGHLHKARLVAGYSQSEMERLTAVRKKKGKLVEPGVTTETIRSWESGRRTPRLGSKIRRYCEVLGVNVHWVLTGQRPRYISQGRYEEKPLALDRDEAIA
jgi:transcriptional regulator with XRE-family HTH domain